MKRFLPIPLSEITIERQLDGALLLAAIVNGYRFAVRFYGYPKREAVRRFREAALRQIA